MIKKCEIGGMWTRLHSTKNESSKQSPQKETGNKKCRVEIDDDRYVKDSIVVVVRVISDYIEEPICILCAYHYPVLVSFLTTTRRSKGSIMPKIQGGANHHVF